MRLRGHHTRLLISITKFFHLLRFLLQSSYNTSSPIGRGVAWHYLHKWPFGSYRYVHTDIYQPFYSRPSPEPLVMAQIIFKGLIQSLCFLSMIALGSTQAPQCPNNLAVYNPDLRTICVNGSKGARLFSVPFLHTVDYILILSHSVHDCTC